MEEEEEEEDRAKFQGSECAAAPSRSPRASGRDRVSAHARATWGGEARVVA